MREAFGYRQKVFHDQNHTAMRILRKPRKAPTRVPDTEIED